MSSNEKPLKAQKRPTSKLIRVIAKGDFNEISEKANNMTIHEINKCAIIWNNSLTPLMQAVRMKNKDVTELLLSLGADVNCRGNIKEGLSDYKQTIPLLLALENHNIEIVKLLCEHGADVNMIITGAIKEEEEGGSIQYVPFTTCLREAIKTQQPEVVSLLLWFGADTTLEQTSGCSYLCFACDFLSYSPSIIKVLVCYGSKLGRQQSEKCCERFLDLLYDTLDLEEWLSNSKSVRNKVRGIQTILLSDYTHKHSPATQAVSLALNSEFIMNYETELTFVKLQEDAKCLKEERKAWTEWLQNHINTVSPLKHICRVAVRGYMDNRLHPSTVKELPIPQTLQSYLLMGYLDDGSL